LQTNKIAFMKHIELIRDYYEVEKIMFFNLLGVNRGDENKLTDYLLDILSDLWKDGE